jgi:hypothetical protein
MKGYILKEDEKKRRKGSSDYPGTELISEINPVSTV